MTTLLSKLSGIERCLEPVGRFAFVVLEAGACPVIVTKGRRGRLMSDIGGEDTGFRFALGSITKVFTALLFLHARQTGALSAGECAYALLGVPSAGSRLPLELLASHASGLPEWPANFAPRPGSLFGHYGEADLLQALRDQAQRMPPAGRYVYSSYGAAVLGLAVARRLGRSYEAACRDFVLRPAGMQQAGFFEGIAPSRPGSDRQEEFTRFGCFTPAGGLLATPADLGALATCLLRVDGSLLANCLSQAESIGLPTGIPDMWAACGWHVRCRAGERIFWHNGRTPGSRAFLAYSRSAGRVVILVLEGDLSLDEPGFSFFD